MIVYLFGSLEPQFGSSLPVAAQVKVSPAKPADEKEHRRDG